MPDPNPSFSGDDIEQQRKEIASYIHDMLDSLQKISAKNELAVLSHLLGAAKAEAKILR
jgi:hypothetical protein